MMPLRKVALLVRGVAGISSAGAASVVVSLILGIFTARLLGPVGQGTLNVVVSVGPLAALTLSLGSGASIRVRAKPLPTEEDVAAYAGLSCVLTVLSSIVTCVGVAALYPGGIGLRDIIALAIYGAGLMAGKQAADLLQAWGRPTAAIMSVAAGTSSQLVLFATLALLGHASVMVAIASASVGSLCQTMWCAVALRNCRIFLRGAWRLSIWRELVALGSPSLGYSLGILLIHRLDRLILAALVGAFALGQYSVAATAAEGLRFASMSIGQLLFVRVAAGGGVTHEVRAIYRLVICLQLVAFGALYFLAPVIMPLLFGPAYSASVGIMRGLLLAEFFMGLALMDSRMIMGLGKLREIGGITVLSVAVAAPIYWLSIKELGTMGAVVASMVSYCGYAVALFSRRRSHQFAAQGVRLSV